MAARKFALRRLALVSNMSNGLSRLTCAECGFFLVIATLGFPASCPMASRVSFVPNMASYGVIMTNVVATLDVGFPKSYPLVTRGSRKVNYGVFYRSCKNLHHDARRRFSSVIYNGIRRLACAKLGVFGGDAMIGVAMLGVGFPTTCPMIPRGLSVPNMAPCGSVWKNGVATPGVGFRTSLPLTDFPWPVCPKSGVLWRR